MTRPGQQVAGIGFPVDHDGLAGPMLRLIYTRTTDDATQDVDEPVGLTTTTPHFGGVHWWFRCPLVAGGLTCGRRVRKLYLPPGGRYFGCRCCHGLTYTSCRESHRDDAMFALLGRHFGVPGRVVKMVLEGAT